MFEDIKFVKPKKLTAAKVGMESKNEIFAELYLSNFKILLQKSQFQTYSHLELSEKFEQGPTIIANLKEKSFSIFLWKSNLSLTYSIIPNIIVVHPTTSMFLKLFIKSNFTKKKPINIIGIEEIIIFKNKILFLKN